MSIMSQGRFRIVNVQGGKLGGCRDAGMFHQEQPRQDVYSIGVRSVVVENEKSGAWVGDTGRHGFRMCLRHGAIIPTKGLK